MARQRLDVDLAHRWQRREAVAQLEPIIETADRGDDDNAAFLTGGASLQASGSFVNDGLLDVMTGAQKIPANLVNNGVVLTASAVKVTSFSLASDTFTLNIQSYTGHTYQLQKSTNLSIWQNVGAAQAGATGYALVMSDTNAAAAGTFYRIGVGP